MAKKRILLRKKSPAQDLPWLNRVTAPFVENRKVLLILSVGVAFLFIVLISGYLYKKNYEHKALRAFTEASILYNSGGPTNEQPSKSAEDYKKAEDLFKRIIQLYPKSRVTSLAYLYLGDIYFQTGEFSNALDSYNNVPESKNGDHFKTFSMYGIGKAYESMERFEEALQKYEEVSRRGGGIGPLVLKDIGRVLETLKRSEEAKKRYEEFLDKNPGSVFVNEVRNRISLLEDKK